MSSIRREFSVLGRLAVPIALTQLTSMLMGIVDLIMVGTVSTEAIGAVSLGNIWKVSSLMVAMGLVLGIDPLVSQAHGARDKRGLGLALQRGIVVAVLASLPIAGLWALTEPCLALFAQDPIVARLAGEYVVVQIPSIAPFLIYTALRQYLTGRGITQPALWITIFANILNAFLNWVLIYGNLGFEPRGATGSGIATSLVQVFLMVGLACWIGIARLQRAAWISWSRAAFDRAGLGLIFRKGFPIGLTLALEMWAFGLATLLAGTLGKTELAAHAVVLSMASTSFMLPLGVAIGTTTRVGNLLGAGRAQEAQRASWVALCLGAGVMAVAALILIAGRKLLPHVYTDEPEVIALCTSILPIAAAFQLFDGTQVVGCGIMRGMGRTLPAALFNLIGYYALAAPIAFWLTHSMHLGLAGIWWGMVIGLASVALSLLMWVRVRGPAHDPGAQLYPRGS